METKRLIPYSVHLREDRRHIQDRDLEVLKSTVQVRLNLEAAIAPAMHSASIASEPSTTMTEPTVRPA